MNKKIEKGLNVFSYLSFILFIKSFLFYIVVFIIGLFVKYQSMTFFYDLFGTTILLIILFYIGYGWYVIFPIIINILIINNKFHSIKRNTFHFISLIIHLLILISLIYYWLIGHKYSVWP